jgi:23S rRNA (cytosine1962-C5)-methyltransferase
MPFRRGSHRKPVRREVRAPSALEWITPATFAAIAAQGTDAHRLASGEGAWLERFGPDLLLSYQTEPERDAVMAELDARCAAFNYTPRRVFGKYLPTQAAERVAPELLRGEKKGPMETEVTEAGVRYGLDFAGGYSAGLFIDQRENRARLRAWKPKRVLNTFAYTCSFSVAPRWSARKRSAWIFSRRSLTRGEGTSRATGSTRK